MHIIWNTCTYYFYAKRHIITLQNSKINSKVFNLAFNKESYIVFLIFFLTGQWQQVYTNTIQQLASLESEICVIMGNIV